MIFSKLDSFACILIISSPLATIEENNVVVNYLGPAWSETTAHFGWGVTVVDVCCVVLCVIKLLV